MADRIIALQDGKVVMDGTPKEVFSDRKHVEEIGLDVPFATSLSDEFIARGYDLPKDMIIYQNHRYTVQTTATTPNRLAYNGFDTIIYMK